MAFSLLKDAEAKVAFDFSEICVVIVLNVLGNKIKELGRFGEKFVQ